MGRFKPESIKDLPLSMQQQIAVQMDCTVASLLKKSKKKSSAAVSEDKLAILIAKRWPEAVFQYKALDSRNFKIDIAFVPEKIAIEVEGWENHGKYKESHQHDCKRNNLIVLEGWSVLRFFHGQVMNDEDQVLSTIESLLNLKRNKL